MLTKRKRRKLEEAGWRVGSVGEFLGLSEIESVIVALRLALHQALKARRLAVSGEKRARERARHQARARHEALDVEARRIVATRKPTR